jgi:hypothetical protein
VKFLAKKKKHKSKVDQPCDFEITHFPDGCMLRNTKMEFQEKSGHTHIYKEQTCRDLINWICNHTVPDSPYLRESAKRVSRDEKYIMLIEIKEEKERNKIKYYNVNRGIVC